MNKPNKQNELKYYQNTSSYYQNLPKPTDQKLRYSCKHNLTEHLLLLAQRTPNSSTNNQVSKK